MAAAGGDDQIVKFGVLLLGAYLFLAYGRIPELIAAKLGFAPPLMPLVMVPALIISILAGGPLLLLRDRTFVLFAGFHAWIVMCLPFSIWKGTSLSMVLYQLKLALILVAIVSLVRSTKHIRGVMLGIAAAMLVLTFAGRNMDTGDEYRFSFEVGSLANPNELANHLLIGLPLASVIAFGRSSFSWQNIVRYAVTISTLFMLAKTGSRGGIVIVLVLGAILVFTLSFANKVKLVLAGATAALVIVAVLSSSTLDRYRTLFSNESKGEASEAVHSTAAREELLRASIRITLEHPIFGVGPAAFVMAYNNERYAQGLRHHWEATHNAYTQISSETGIPSLILYIGAFVTAITRLLRLRRATKSAPQLQSVFYMTSVLLLSMAAYLTSGFFTSNAHEFYFSMLIGLAIALDQYGNRELSAFLPARAIPTAPPVVNRAPRNPVPVRRPAISAHANRP